MVAFAPQMFAQVVTILRDKYPEIDHLKGVCNQRIARMRAKVCREFLIKTSKCGLERIFAHLFARFCTLFGAKTRPIFSF
jgi:hypothetical protein